ncbi:MAG: hypothetical protein E8D50_12175 [Nitrospira sp.]|nr:hypothetical protein [Nitrospira sp.]TKB52561.1 MAG: hypothetical protein E8D50_12175 [Nitrospira sp.]
MRHSQSSARWVWASLLMFASLGVLTGEPRAEPKAEKTFVAVVTDAQGVDTEIRNLIFYWEEKVSETAFVPHELRHLPVKRGSTTNNIPFDKIKQVETKPAGSEGITVLVTLANGKTGEFVLTIPGSFRGESDFGQADVQAKSVAKVVLK